ncbi:MAG: hypothetical protein RSD95_15760, partial [Clostridia bacterium]
PRHRPRLQNLRLRRRGRAAPTGGNGRRAAACNRTRLPIPGAQSPGTIAEKCYEVALKILKDEPFDRLILTDSWLINAQNVETFGFDNWQ